ncbi:MAG TPA: hypothetical protein VNA13_05080 [Xanthomonadales bacterium]|nr:hypothetical protein [Xanthomonadales bacterium]
MSSEGPPHHVDIEAGHFYSRERVYQGYPDVNYPEGGPGEIVQGPHILQGIRVAQGLIKILEEKGITSGKSLFADDTALMSYWSGKENEGMVVARTIGVTTQQIYDSGYTPHLMFRESELEDPARHVADRIKEYVSKSDKYTLSEDGRKLKYKENGEPHSIKLFGKDNEPYDPDYPSCEVLDLTLYQKRLQIAPAVITVLPEHYKSQQERVKKLFEILEEEPSVVVVYFNEEGVISEVDPWSDGARNLAETIQTAA